MSDTTGRWWLAVLKLVAVLFLLGIFHYFMSVKKCAKISVWKIVCIPMSKGHCLTFFALLRRKMLENSLLGTSFMWGWCPTPLPHCLTFPNPLWSEVPIPGSLVDWGKFVRYQTSASLCLDTSSLITWLLASSKCLCLNCKGSIQWHALWSANIGKFRKIWKKISKEQFGK